MKDFLSNLKEKMDKLINSPIAKGSNGYMADNHLTIEPSNHKPIVDSFHCPYCQSTDFVRRGFRQKKMEKIQLYLCNTCGRTFTEQITKGKHYPIALILKTLSYYNLGHSLEATCRMVKELTGQSPQPSSLAVWLKEFDKLCRFSRLREFVTRLYSPEEMVITANLAHRQLYRFLYHRGKCEIIIKEDIKHRRYKPLQEFLEMVPGECPHQYFVDGKSAGLRASEAPLTFSKTAMIVQAKQNYANELCRFVLQSVKDRKSRHAALQQFLICNDSVTVACEVPVYLTRDDIEHMKTQLGFQIYPRVIPTSSPRHPGEESATTPGSVPSAVILGSSATPGSADAGQASMTGGEARMTNTNDPLPTLPDLPAEASAQAGVESEVPAEVAEMAAAELPKLITGHIDIVQIRNGMVHLLDYKPNAAKEQPIEQLTLYAMALSRLTGLRLFEFKCAWFDEKDYFEFYPLHVLHKTKKSLRRRKITTKEGTYQVNRNEKKVENVRPTYAKASAGGPEKVSVKVEGNQE